MKSVLKRAEEATRLLSVFKLEDLKLKKLNIADNDPNTGSFRIKGYIKVDSFIEIFEFLFEGEITKYSYTFIESNQTTLRYDNAPHFKKIKTFPHHKHIKDEILPLDNVQLTEFIKKVKEILKK